MALLKYQVPDLDEIHSRTSSLDNVTLDVRPFLLQCSNNDDAIPGKRCSATVTIVADRFMVLIGGGVNGIGESVQEGATDEEPNDHHHPNHRFQHYNDIHVLDLHQTMRKGWQKIEASAHPAADEEGSGHFQARRGHTTTLLPDDGFCPHRLIVHGGINDDQQLLSDTWLLEIYIDDAKDDDADEGTAKECQELTKGGDEEGKDKEIKAYWKKLKTHRNPTVPIKGRLALRGHMAVLHDHHHLIVIGGENAAEFPPNAGVLILYLKTMIWSYITPSIRPSQQMFWYGWSLSFSAFVQKDDCLLFHLDQEGAMACLHLWKPYHDQSSSSAVVGQEGGGEQGGWPHVMQELKWELYECPSSRLQGHPPPGTFCPAYCPFGPHFLLVFGGSSASGDSNSFHLLDLRHYRQEKKDGETVGGGEGGGGKGGRLCWYEAIPSFSTCTPLHPLSLRGYAPPSARNAACAVSFGPHVLLFGGGIFGVNYFNDLYLITLEMPLLPLTAPPPPSSSSSSSSLVDMHEGRRRMGSSEGDLLPTAPAAEKEEDDEHDAVLLVIQEKKDKKEEVELGYVSRQAMRRESEVLGAWLAGPFREGRAEKVILPNDRFGKEEWERMLGWMRGGTEGEQGEGEGWNEEVLVDMLCLADMYAIERLRRVCEVMLVKRIEKDQVIDLWCVARAYHCPALEEHCLAFLARLLREEFTLPFTPASIDSIIEWWIVSLPGWEDVEEKQRDLAYLKRKLEDWGLSLASKAECCI